jgi:hypothetical protein
VLSGGCNGSEEPGKLSREELLKPSTCEECHADHYREWSGSMHAYASEDPVFTAMNARGQEETGGALGAFCVNCHAPMAVREGATEDGLNLSTLPEELQGITCYFCHNVDSVEGTHNNPLVLANDTTMRGGIPEPVENSAHHSEYSRLFDASDVMESSKLCGTCHDIVVPKELTGAPEDVHLERTYEEWRTSLFAQPDSGPLSCGDCHMDGVPNVPVADAENVPVRDARHKHDFPGVDVAVTDFPQKQEQLAAVQRFLETTLRSEICVSQTGFIRVSLENVTAVHNVPSGASQDRRLWVEVRGFDFMGQETFTAGIPPEGTAVADIDGQEGTWLLRDRTFDAAGEPAHMFWDVATVERATLLAPITISPLDPEYHREIDSRTYQFPGLPSRVIMTIKMQPIGRDVLEDLVASRHLDPSIVDAMPTFDLRPNRLTEPAAQWTLEWTDQRAQAEGYVVSDSLCLETARQKR